MSDELEALLRAARPEPSAALRARVLAATATVERIPPWWARARTWAAAALILLTVDVIVSQPRGSAAAAAPETAVVQVDDTIVPYPALARLAAPRPEARNAPTPRSTLEEIYR